MLLRSSSTPVLGSLLSSFSETPNNRRFSNSEYSNATTPEHVSSSIIPRNNYSKISYNKHAGHSQNSTTSLYNNSSSISPSVSEVLSGNSQVGGFRRAQSEGNLEGLAAASWNNIDEFNFSIPSKKPFGRPPRCSTLKAIPSLSYHNWLRDGNEDEEDSEEEEEEVKELKPENENGTYSDPGGVKNLCFEEDRIKYAASRYENNSGLKKEGTMELYLARGLGISDLNVFDIGGHIHGGSGGGGQGYRPVAFGRDGGGDGHGGLIMEEHYKKMLEENPCNPLCLRNYAQFLHQTKKDLPSAEEYYSRAILADPTDGDVLCQYAKLVWELHHDSDRARDYFERAVRAAGQDSHIQAAYACFLWETAADEDEDCPPSDGAKQRPISLVKEGVTA